MTKRSAISPFWTAILITVLSSSIIGIGAYVSNAKAALAVLESKVLVIENANLPDRLARMEEQMRSTNKGLDSANEKLDRLLRK